MAFVFGCQPLSFFGGARVAGGAIVDESNGALAFICNQMQIGGGVGMGLRKSDGALRTKLNSAIASVKSGTLNKIIAV